MQGIIYIAIAQILKVKFYQYYCTCSFEFNSDDSNNNNNNNNNDNDNKRFLYSVYIIINNCFRRFTMY